MQGRFERPVVVITGANGGMGRACARLLGATMDLVLTDGDPGLQQFSEELNLEGFTVLAAVTGNLGSESVLRETFQALEGRPKLDALVHTCGLGPSSRSWRDVLTVNYSATVQLLDRVEPYVGDGTVAVLIASVAAYLAPDDDAIEALLQKPTDPALCDKLEPLLLDIAGPAGEKLLGVLSYAISKKKVLDLCAGRASDWGERGARICAISPGMTYTPMGRAEAAVDPLSESLVHATPIGRWGTPAEIALVTQFLLSPSAAFITGSDIKLDGGSLAASIKSPGEWLEGLKGIAGN